MSRVMSDVRRVCYKPAAAARTSYHKLTFRHPWRDRQPEPVFTCRPGKQTSELIPNESRRADPLVVFHFRLLSSWYLGPGSVAVRPHFPWLSVSSIPPGSEGQWAGTEAVWTGRGRETGRGRAVPPASSTCLRQRLQGCLRCVAHAFAAR